MRVRLILELTYPGATSDDETRVKEKLVSCMVELAREKKYDVDSRVAVEEVAVGCSVIPDIVLAGVSG